MIIQLDQNSNPSTKNGQGQKSKVREETIQQWYCKKLSSWVSHIERFYKNQFKIWPLCDDYVNEVFLPRVMKKFRLKVLFDRKIADSILLKLSYEPEFLIFSTQSAKMSKQNIDKAILNQKSFNEAQKWRYIVKIAYLLKQNNFISRIDLNNILQACSPNRTVQYKLNQFCNYMQKDNDSQTKIKINVWNSIVGMDCKQFWTSDIVKWQSLVKNNDIMKLTFKIFQKYLAKKLSPTSINKIKVLIGETQYLQEAAALLCLFSYPKKIKQIQKQLQNIKKIIVSQFETKKHKNRKIVKFQTYGSFRNQICLQSNSDVDLTVFVADSKGEIAQDHQFICQALIQIANIFYKQLKLKNQEMKIQNVMSVANNRIKVPFARVKFTDGMPIQQMDIVVNNIYGVKNSMFLKLYSQNKYFRNCALLLKLWAKKNRFINPQKLSSYGLTLTLLYYLMSNKSIEFPTYEQVQNLSVNNQVIQKQTILSTLIGYFKFYSKYGLLSQQNTVVCIIKGCHQHEDIIKQQFVINIHDPFDGTNPGRLKRRDQLEFFNQVQVALEKLSDASQLPQGDQIKQLNNFFGLQYEIL